MTTPRPFNVAAGLLALVVALAWGCNYAASKHALLHFPPFFTIFIRYVIVTLLLLPFARIRPLPWHQLFIFSALMISMHFTLVFAAMWLGLDIPTTVVVTQLGAPFTCVLGAIFLKDRLGPWRTGGMSLAFLGIVVIAGTPNVADNGFAFALAVIGSMAWAGSNIYAKMVGQSPIMPLLFWTGLLSLPQTLLVSLLIESDHLLLLETVPQSAVIGICYSAIVSTIIGYGLWYYLLRTYPVSQVAPFSLLVPIGGFGSGWVFFDMVLTPEMMLGAALTIVGVAIITIRMPMRLSRLGDKV
jgi:O-acetylserine/cysteine efflux transporter